MRIVITHLFLVTNSKFPLTFSETRQQRFVGMLVHREQWVTAVYNGIGGVVGAGHDVVGTPGLGRGPE